ncbi:uncharacterized protein LOC134267767 [Saccostrea cucullata]|uniref:uncharacterized protein LOC134267767 n=1 Tax=Saccostrea cuccullata TaxID=36930 RepID=UPI002ED1BAB5
MLIILYKWQRRRHCIEKKDGNLTDDMVFTPKQQQNENGLGDSRISKERNQILAPSFISCQLNDDNSACNSSQSRSERMVKNTELHLSSLQTPQKDGYCHNKRTDSQKRSDLCKVSSTSPDASRNLINENLDELNLYQNFNAAENMCSVPDTTNANLQELGSDSKALGPDSLQQQRPYSSVKYNRNKREDKQENALDFASDELQMEVGKSSNVKDIDEVYGFDMKEVQCMRSHEILK